MIINNIVTYELRMAGCNYYHALCVYNSRNKSTVRKQNSDDIAKAIALSAAVVVSGVVYTSILSWETIMMIIVPDVYSAAASLSCDTV